MGILPILQPEERVMGIEEKFAEVKWWEDMRLMSEYREASFLLDAGVSDWRTLSWWMQR